MASLQNSGGSSSPTNKKEEVLIERNLGDISKSLNEHMYLVVRSLKHNNEKIEYTLQKGDIIKLGRIKFAVKEIAIVDNSMDVDETNQTVKAIRHANVESIDDEEFFEFEEVESVFNDMTEEEIHSTSAGSKEEIPTCKFCWSPATERVNPLISCCKCAGSVGFIHYNCLK